MYKKILTFIIVLAMPCFVLAQGENNTSTITQTGNANEALVDQDTGSGGPWPQPG